MEIPLYRPILSDCSAGTGCGYGAAVSFGDGFCDCKAYTRAAGLGASWWIGPVEAVEKSIRVRNLIKPARIEDFYVNPVFLSEDTESDIAFVVGISYRIIE